MISHGPHSCSNGDTLLYNKHLELILGDIISSIWELAIHILVAQRVYKLSTSRSFSNIFFLLLSPTNFEQDWVLYTAVCFHIMTQKMTGSVELNLQWELYFFTHLFSSTGLWCLLVLGLGLQFNINEICMLYLLVSNPCILSSGYNVSVKNTTLHLIS